MKIAMCFYAKLKKTLESHPFAVVLGGVDIAGKN